MVKLARPFSDFKICRIMVVGDFMLDRYTLGKANRISPEAPVAVLNVSHEEQRAGGAGNVVLNLRSLEAEVVAVGRVGNDVGGQAIRSALESENVETHLYIDNEILTPIKNRIIADNQQIVRIDYEKVFPLSPSIEEIIVNALPELTKKVDIIAISDYGKGFLSKRVLKTLIVEAKKKGIPVVTDPKGMDFSKYSGSTVIKPNFSEAIQAAGLGVDSTLDQVAIALHKKVEMEYLVITRSQEGISIFPKNNARMDFPVQAREVKDVTGAGDTVLSTLTCGLASGLTIAEACQLSNVAAGIAIEKIGCARISLADLAHRLLNLEPGNKVFDEEHFFALQHALKQSSCNIALLSTKQDFTLELFDEIRKLSQENKLIIFIQDKNPDERAIKMLSSLQEVDFIIRDGLELNRLISCLQPQRIVDLSTILV